MLTTVVCVDSGLRHKQKQYLTGPYLTVNSSDCEANIFLEPSDIFKLPLLSKTQRLSINCQKMTVKRRKSLNWRSWNQKMFDFLFVA